ncbi:MAG: YhfC family intramembrane metalloprotease [Oscillospiraceae bacterium]|nr:YhfC family intramembrane metalloprotease [Oscillospiraceae bacterium]
MNGSVPSLSIVCMAISCAVSFCLPVILLFYFRKKKGADILPFFIGCAVMLLFALILEAAVHTLVLASAAGAYIQDHLWLYALYGGFMAGLFEETGRWIAFRTVLKRRQDKDTNALMYGAGHGGFEAAAIVGVAMINNLIWSVMINSGNSAALTGSLTGDTLAQVQQSMQTLVSTPSYQFLLGGAERIFAVAIQISLSVLVWLSVTKPGKGYFYPAAILIHLIVDAVTVILSGKGVSAILLEAVVGCLAVLIALLTKEIWKRCTAES